jgi:hypothetical protein
MGIKVMKNQINPDGREGHLERLEMQEQSRKFPRKLKFIGGGNHDYTVPNLSKSDQRLLDIETMKLRCNLYKPGCQIKNCHAGCKVNRPTDKSKKYVMMRRFMKREDYWRSNIAFKCPIRGDIHTINDCFQTCESWGREYQFDVDGKTVAILNCLADPHGERELHSGKVTRDN